MRRSGGNRPPGANARQGAPGRPSPGPARSPGRSLPRPGTERRPIPPNLEAVSGAPLRLSILDQSPVSEGSSHSQALRNTLDLARLADELGYHRYWLAEHHGGPMLAGPSPEALIGPVAAATSRIRVG